MSELESKLADALSDVIAEIYNEGVQFGVPLAQAMVRAHNALRAYNRQRTTKSIFTLVERAHD